MQVGDLFIQDLGQDINTDVLLASLAEFDVFLAEFGILGLVQHDLSKDLVGEGAGHDEGRVPSGASQVDQATLGQENDMVAIWHEKAIDLGFDVLD